MPEPPATHTLFSPARLIAGAKRLIASSLSAIALLVPDPCRAHDVIQGAEARLPTEFVHNPLGAGHQHGGIAAQFAHLGGDFIKLVLAARREQHFAAMSEEVAEMYATVDNPIEYLIHDVRFHRVIAQASGNPILAALMETITSALYDERRKTAERSRDLKVSADMHRQIYRAIRSRNAAEARSLMRRHLTLAQSAQDMEETAGTVAGKGGRTRSRKPD